MFAKSIVVFMTTDENLYKGHLGDRILVNLKWPPGKWPLWRGGRSGEVRVLYDKFSTEFDCRGISVIVHRSASNKLAVDPLVLLVWG